MTAKTLAIKLIKYQVDRGDSLEFIRSGHSGFSGDEGSVQIGGWQNGKRYSTHFILVQRIGSYKTGKEANIVFKIEDIYNEIKNPSKQLTLV